MECVRWAAKTVRKEFLYTKWHITNDNSFTLCGLPIILASKNGTFLPDLNDDLDKVSCKKCKNKHDKMVVL